MLKYLNGHFCFAIFQPANSNKKHFLGIDSLQFSPLQCAEWSSQREHPAAWQHTQGHHRQPCPRFYHRLSSRALPRAACSPPGHKGCQQAAQRLGLTEVQGPRRVFWCVLLFLIRSRHFSRQALQHLKLCTCGSYSEMKTRVETPTRPVGGRILSSPNSSYKHSERTPRACRF